MNVLVVDDSGLMRRILSGILSQECEISKIQHATDGKDALERWKQESFDLILLDWNMPEMLGIEVLRTIRVTDMETVVIFVTTEAEKENIIEAIKEGANDYIIKPFTKEIVARKVERVKRRIAQRRMEPSISHSPGMP